MKNRKTIKLSKYDRAKLKVASLRSFYNHAIIYVIINMLLYLFRDKFTFILISKTALGNPDILDWIDWNVFGTSIVWGVILIFHAVKTFSNFTLLAADWEQRQIEKYVKEDLEESKKFE